MRAIAYVRVSTEEQTQGLSLSSQRDVVAAEVLRRGWTLEDIASDAASGKSLKRRPGLSRALERLDDGEFDVLAVARLDRLSRSAADVYGLMDRASRRDWSIVCLDPPLDMTTPFGRAAAGMAGVFAQLERELIAQRQRESVAARRAAGTYRPPKPLVSEDAVRRMMALREQKLSYATIASRLELEGFPPLRADRWHGRTVSKILSRAS